MKSTWLIIFLFNTLLSCGQADTYDLIIKNAKVFNSNTATVSDNTDILIKTGVIVAIGHTQKNYTAKRTIDARGRLVTPGFIDTHIHPTDVFGDYDAAPEYLAKDSLEQLRARLTDAYLPYGVTTAITMGQPEKWLTPLLQWSANPTPYHIDLYVTGGALISEESRKPYVAHTTVESPWAAKQKVLAYHRQGIRHVKLYWRLQKPEFIAALKTADSLGMRMYAHLDQNIVTIDSALAFGLRNYEHTLTLDNSVLNWATDTEPFTAQMRKFYGFGNVIFPAVRLEMFRYIHEHKGSKMDSIINSLAGSKATFSTSIHLMAEQFGITYFSNSLDSTLSKTQLARSKENFKIFMNYNKQLHDKGVKLRIGTDAPNGGKVLQSEQMLMYEYGFPVAAILQISTINGATSMGLDKEVGSIEKGKKANLVIFDKNPFDHYKNFLAGKTVIKNGIVLPSENIY